MTMEEINQRLFDLAEEKNAKRSSSIIPGAKMILGARIPALRKLAKQIAKENYHEFLEKCPDEYMEQQVLQALVLGYAKDDIETILSCADVFIPKIQDWCVNDSFCQTFAIAEKNRERVFTWLMRYAEEQKEYSQRVVAVICLSHFLTDDYICHVLEVMNRLTFDAYYTKMGVAWCVATAYAKFPEETRAFLDHNCLSDWTYNKTIQKITESLRVPKEDKVILRAMKR